MPKQALDDYTQDLFADMEEVGTEEQSELDFSAPQERDEVEDDDDSLVDSLPSSDDEEAEEESSDDDSGQDEESDDDSSAADESDEDDDEDETDEEDEDEVEKVRQAMLRDLQKERRENAELKAKMNIAQQQMNQLQQQPVPPPPQQTTMPNVQPQTEDLGIPVQVSPDGQNVYVDRQMLAAEYDRLAQQRQAQPDPAQVAEQTDQIARQMFVEGDPSDVRRQETSTRAQQASGYLALKMQELVMQGHQIASPAQGLQVMRALGQDQEFNALYPDIAPHVDEFADTMAYGSPLLRSRMLERIHEPAEQSQQQDEVLPTTTPKRVKKGGPKSMAQKGGARSEPKTAKQAEYEQLRAQFQKNIMSFPRKKFNRMKALGRELGIQSDTEDFSADDIAWEVDDD